MKSVLVTGATGYLGAKIVKHLQSEGFLVYALCRSTPKDLHSKFDGVKIIEGDITHSDTLNEISAIPLNYVVHTVSLDHNQSEHFSLEEVNKTNVLATWQLLEQYTRLKLDKFIYLSTMQVLGKLNTGPVTEAYPKSPLNKYGLTHSIGEELINYYDTKTDTQCISLRLSNGYGAPTFDENNCWWLVINDLCKTAYYNKEIVLTSDGTPTRDFIHIEDISNAIAIILKASEKVDPVIHISSGKTQSLLEIAHRIKSVYEKRYAIQIPVFYSTSILSEKQPAALEQYTLRNDKLLSMGFQPQKSLDQGIEELFVYFENLNVQHA